MCHVVISVDNHGLHAGLILHRLISVGVIKVIIIIIIMFVYYAPPVRKRAISVAFVRLSVAYIANNSRTRRPSVPKFGRKVLHLLCDWRTSFKVKRSKIKVTRPINADTHRAPYLNNGNAYELQTWYTDGGRRPASATGAMTSNVKSQGHKLTSYVRLISASS